jgi:hypothetical protein
MSGFSAGTDSAAAAAAAEPQSESLMSKLSSKMKKLFGGREESEPEVVIGKPTGFKHLNHVKVDDRSSTGFTVFKMKIHR